jgi:hypothetical protein
MELRCKLDEHAGRTSPQSTQSLAEFGAAGGVWFFDKNHSLLILLQ